MKKPVKLLLVLSKVIINFYLCSCVFSEFDWPTDYIHFVIKKNKKKKKKKKKNKKKRKKKKEKTKQNKKKKKKKRKKK